MKIRLSSISLTMCILNISSLPL